MISRFWILCIPSFATAFSMSRFGLWKPNVKKYPSFFNPTDHWNKWSYDELRRQTTYPVCSRKHNKKQKELVKKLESSMNKGLEEYLANHQRCKKPGDFHIFSCNKFMKSFLLSPFTCCN